MRRKDREVRDRAAVDGILRDGEYCHLALSRENKPYSIPMSFGYAWEGEALILYFHCAKEGEKLDILRQNNRASVSIVASAELYAKDADVGCTYGSYYRSLVAHGEISVVNEIDEKAKGLALIMGHYAPEREFSFGERECNMVTVLRFVAESWSAKENRPGE